MDVNYTCSGDHFAIYTNTKSLCFIPETNIILCINYISPPKPPLFPVFYFFFGYQHPHFLSLGGAHSFSCKGSWVYILWGKSRLIRLTCFGPVSHIPTMKSWLVKLKVWFWLFSGQVKGVILTLLGGGGRRDDFTACLLSSSQEQCKWRQRDFHLSKARRIFGEEGVRPEGCGCFKIGYHFVGRLSLGVICKLYSNVVISPNWALCVVRVAILCWGLFWWTFLGEHSSLHSK